MQIQKGHTTIECLRADITRQDDFTAVVNAANAQLRPGGGVAGAIHRAAGPELDRACRQYAPIEPGEAVVTEAFELPNDWVIHTLGPVYGQDEPAADLLAACYRNCLDRAEEKVMESVVFPALSTGAFGYPMEEAARVALETLSQRARTLQHVMRIRLALFGSDALETHEAVLRRLGPS